MNLYMGKAKLFKNEKLKSGSIIHWSERDIGHKGYAPVTCGRCKNKRELFIYRTNWWTGYCYKCGAINRKTNQTKPYIIRDGYRYLLVSSLSKIEQKFARKLTKDKYVVEHRLVMSIKLKRKLKPEEIVHHLNEVKTDNRLCNLTITTRQAHSAEHASILKMARAEVKRLQNILDKNNIKY